MNDTIRSKVFEIFDRAHEKARTVPKSMTPKDRLAEYNNIEDQAVDAATVVYGIDLSKPHRPSDVGRLLDLTPAESAEVRRRKLLHRAGI